MIDRDERLAAILNDLSEEKRRGHHPDVEQVANRHPDLADELRQLWAIAQVAQVCARPSELTQTLDRPRPVDPPSGALPRTFGDYELLEELGRGGMGVVYKARQKSLNRIVALKMLLHGDAASADDRTRIRAEAKAAALLKHPNIVAVFDVGECDGRDYFTMPFIEGMSLAHLLAEGPMPPRDAAQLVAAVAHAVHHAHQQGIIHRDLKPGNILISEPGFRTSDSTQPTQEIRNPKSEIRNPLVTDFGLAKQLASPQHSLTQTGAILGTPSFMPPEQAASNRGAIGPASDVYSLGAILYNCLTGRPPFQAANRYDVIFMVLEQDPVPPRLLNPKVDRDLEIICLKCLQKSPELRYESAAHLAKDLEAFLAGEPLSIRPSELRDLIGRLFRPTHHITILENWGGLWMAHSLFTFLLCLLTWGLQQGGVTNRLVYMSLWSAGVMLWGGIFWHMRRRIGPVTFVERQIAHVWAAGVSGTFGVLVLEWLLDRPVLEFAPIIGVLAGMVFLCKAGILSGMFYFAVAGLFSAALLMTHFRSEAMLIYGVTLAACYFVPGWIFYRRRRATQREGRE
jgi:eukaryotic-like serine/threonine-protein kinase